MKPYDHKEIEKKWRKEWERVGLYKTEENTDKPKCFVLDMFPFPSGDGLHVGHPKGYIATDVYSRFKKMNGFNILHPMGWDAFGLPAEQYAIKNKIHPRMAVEKNIARFKEQLSIIGLNYDWEREINTTDPEYYKWTQWIFLKMFEKGLAYESFEPVNWCPSCQTGLANEDLEGGECERCGTLVEKKPMRQWVLRITDYAEALLADIDGLQWPESIKESQRNWIGKSEGAEIEFRILNFEFRIKVFTTRPDTLFGATYIVLSPEHELVEKLKNKISNWNEVEKYREEVKNKTEIERTSEGREKTGVRLEGITAINPANNEEIPIFIADYVLSHYGTGAIMAVPAHDERDFEFAKKFNLPIKTVVENEHLIDSGEFTGMDSEEAKKAITEFVGGKMKTTYKLRDWVFSRQRYWGEPIPIIHCEACKNKKQKVLLVHGFEGSPTGNWMPWMKAELEARGFEVFAPELPDAAHPDMDAWLNTLLPILENFTEEDIVIGHSLGGKAAIHAIEKAGKKLKHAYLIASAIGEIKKRDWEKMKTDSPNSDIVALQKFWQGKTDFNAVSRLTNVTAVISDDDPYVPLKTHDDIPREWEFKIWRGFKHFQGKQSPELLEEFLRSKNTDAVPVLEKDLPVKLPDVEFYEPIGTGESPLAAILSWVNVKCPKCGGEGKRETNTMPNWAGSSWYYLRFIDPKNSGALVDKEKEKYWMGCPLAAPKSCEGGVDMYVGGAEHATRHLIYARFWHKFLYDIGAVNYAEPFLKLRNVGLILAEDGRKMSKRWGNVVNPDVIVGEYGADTLRVYEMFMGPFEQSTAWSMEGIVGPRRFLEKVWKIFSKLKIENEKVKTTSKNERLETLLHQTIKKVTGDIENFKFNTAISALMIFTNALEKEKEISNILYSYFLILLSPFAPHITEELWHELGNENSIYLAKWPKYDDGRIISDTITIAVQVNGKVRATFEIENDSSEEEATKKALSLSEIKKWLEGKNPQKVIYVKKKIVNIVV